MEERRKIAIFASGGGSNARAILEYLYGDIEVEVGLIVSNKRKAGVLLHAADFDVPSLVIDRDFFYHGRCILDVLASEEITHIVLAGFLWLVPPYLIQAYEGQMLNIHPALLPSYGGKGMYGMHIHRAVKANGDDHTGLTIHLVNEQFDKGEILFQHQVPVSPADTAEDIAAKVLAEEHIYYPQVIHRVVTGGSLDDLT